MLWCFVHAEPLYNTVYACTIVINGYTHTLVYEPSFLMCPRLPSTDWNQLRAAYTAGAGLRALARNAGIPEGTILSRAKREGWTQTKQEALSLMQPAGEDQRDITQSIAIENAERGQRHVALMQGLAEKLGSHAASLAPALLFEGVSKLNTLDLLARRNFGLENGQKSSVQLTVLTDGASCFDMQFPIFEAEEGED